LYIDGGYVYVNAIGDGVDSNGSIEMTGGVVLVSGPTVNNNGALDYMGTFNISGGVFLAAGSAGMVQAPSASSTQNSITVVLDSVQQAGTLFSIQIGEGENILTCVPSKSYQSVIYSSPVLTNGETLNVYTGGTSTGDVKDDLIRSGDYTPGELVQSVTLNSTVTTIGNNIGFGGGHRR
jgi:hypothetical protein